MLKNYCSCVCSVSVCVCARVYTCACWGVELGRPPGILIPSMQLVTLRENIKYIKYGTPDSGW